MKYSFFRIPDGSALPLFHAAATWVILIICGFFFTAGSWVSCRAFEYPPVKPLLGRWSCCFSDELLSAWLFLFGALPAPLFVAIFLYAEPDSLDQWAMMIMAIILVTVSAVFVHICRFPQHGETKSYVTPLLKKMLCGDRSGVVERHLFSDWLVTAWMMYYMSLITTVASFLMMLFHVQFRNDRQIFIFGSGCLDTIFFLVGCMYYLGMSISLLYVSCHYFHF